jgi:hypothetical protein
MNLQQQEQFYQLMNRLKGNSRVASLPKEGAIVTEIVDGLIVSKLAKKIEHISEPGAKTSEPEAQVWNLTKDGPVLQSKAASVHGINKLKVIHDFMFAKRY